MTLRSASSLNTGYSSTFKLQLQDKDYIAAMIRAAMLERQRHGIADTWFGRTLDLSKAYKQLAIMPEHAHLAVVGFPVGGQWRFYKSVALPFGATGSAYGFVRVSPALWCIGISTPLHCDPELVRAVKEATRSPFTVPPSAGV